MKQSKASQKKARRDEELVNMVRHYALDNHYFERSPLLQEMHRRGWNEGVLEGEKRGEKKGKKAGIIKGRLEGRKEGEEAGILKGEKVGRLVQQRESIMQVFLGRFDLKWSRSQKVVQSVEKLAPEMLQGALLKAATVAEPEIFEKWLEDAQEAKTNKS